MMNTNVSMLNEYSQSKQMLPPEYKTIAVTGLGHMPTFTIGTIIGNREFEAQGPSKKVAKHNCARIAVDALKVKEYFNSRIVCKYRICELNAVSDKINSADKIDSTTSLETIWNGDAEEVVLIIKRSKNNDQELKTIRLKVLK